MVLYRHLSVILGETTIKKNQCQAKESNSDMQDCLSCVITELTARFVFCLAVLQQNMERKGRIRSEGFSYRSVLVDSAFLHEEMDNSGLFGFIWFDIRPHCFQMNAKIQRETCTSILKLHRQTSTANGIYHTALLEIKEPLQQKTETCAMGGKFVLIILSFYL